MPVIKVKGGYKVRNGNKVFRTKAQAAKQLIAIEISKKNRKSGNKR